MSKYFKILSVFAVVIAGLFTLAACKDEETFYTEWHEAGADIEEDHIFKVISVEKAVSMKDAGDDFVVFLGASSQAGAVNAVTAIQKAAELTSYEGYVYFIDTTDVLASGSVTEKKDIIDSLKIYELNPSDGSGVVAVAYEDGNRIFDTSRYSIDPDDEYMNYFEDRTGKSLDFYSIAEYAFKMYPVTE